MNKNDLAKACALIKKELIRLEVPEGSALHFLVNGKEQVEPIHERPNYFKGLEFSRASHHRGQAGSEDVTLQQYVFNDF